MEIWFVFLWLSDFDLLDNRFGDWDVLNFVWGFRRVRFSEFLLFVIEVGCNLNFVINNDLINDVFEERFK